MAESPPPLRVAADIGGAAGLGGLIVTGILYLLSLPLPLVLVMGGVSFGALCVGILGHVFLSNNLSFETLGSLETVPPPANDHVLPLEPKREQSLSLEEIERHYELKKLEPNLQATSVDPEIVAAHFDEQGIIVIQPDPSAADTFDAYVVPITNASASRVGEAKKVRARITFRAFEQSQSGTVHRGAWLSEKETEIDFPPDCSPRRLILITVEGKQPRLRVFSISRDFDSPYTGTLAMREELHGEFYEFKVAIFDERHAAKPLRRLEYILQVGHLLEGACSVTLNNAFFWKSGHLHEFTKEGFAFSMRLHEIWKDAHEQFPIDNAPTPSPTLAAMLSSEKPPEKITYFDSVARIQAIEREQEEKLIEEMKNWESRAADFIGRYVSTDQREQFLKCVPSIEDGFNRAQKPTFRFRILPRSGTQKEAPPELPYWTLSSAINSRTDKLMKISEQLK